MKKQSWACLGHVCFNVVSQRTRRLLSFFLDELQCCIHCTTLQLVPFKENSDNLFQNVATPKTIRLYLFYNAYVYSVFEMLKRVQGVCK